MNANAKRVLQEAMGLPSEDRAELFEVLGARLVVEGVEIRDGLSEAWQSELARRIAKIDAGQTQLVDIDELESDLRLEQYADETARMPR